MLLLLFPSYFKKKLYKVQVVANTVHCPADLITHWDIFHPNGSTSEIGMKRANEGYQILIQIPANMAKPPKTKKEDEAAAPLCRSAIMVT